MRAWMPLCLMMMLMTMTSAAFATCLSLGSGQSCPRDCGKSQDTCCSGMGGVSYCDSSAGFLVCNNGHYSTCYCDRHAVMDFQAIQGCCVWQGGVQQTEQGGHVICRNGQEAELCSIQTHNQHKSYSNF